VAQSLAQSLASELATVEAPPAEVEAPCAELAMVEPPPAAPCAELATLEPGPAPPCADLASEEPGPVAPREALAIADLLQLDPELTAASPPPPSLGEVAVCSDPSVQMELASLLMEPVPELTPPSPPSPELMRMEDRSPTPPWEKEDNMCGADPTDLP
jgi:hypothetical protein